MSLIYGPKSSLQKSIQIHPSSGTLSSLLKNHKPNMTKAALKIVFTFLEPERETETSASLKSGSVEAKGNFASVKMELIQMQNGNVGKSGCRKCKVGKLLEKLK